MIVNWNWRTREMVVHFLKVFIPLNIYSLKQSSDLLNETLNLLTKLLLDDQLEVRELACFTLASLISWDILPEKRRDDLIEQFREQANVTNGLVTRHGAFLGLCAFVYAYPDDLPPFLPGILMFLTERLSEGQPISKSVSTALSVFKRLHENKWFEYESKFTDEQLTQVQNSFFSASYFV